MDDCVRRYLEHRKKKLQMKLLRQVMAEYRETQRRVQPALDAYRKRERERRSRGDGFVIVTDYK